ncbi:MAG: hypothetical protein RR368_06890, partial [Oscillospiraceae bacterium]
FENVLPSICRSCASSRGFAATIASHFEGMCYNNPEAALRERFTINLPKLRFASRLRRACRFATEIVV